MIGLIYKFQCMGYENCEYYLNRKTLNFKWFFVENKTDNAAFLKNAVSCLNV
jgi:hypothetical protein